MNANPSWLLLSTVMREAEKLHRTTEEKVRNQFGDLSRDQLQPLADRESESFGERPSLASDVKCWLFEPSF